MSLRIRQVSGVAVLAALCASTVGAGLAWACAPSSWGWSAPATPESTPAAGGNAGAGAPPATGVAPAGGLAPAQASPSPQPAQSPAQQPAQSPAQQPSRTQPKQPARTPAGEPSGGFAPRGVAPGAAQGSGTGGGTVRPARSAAPGRADRSTKGKRAEKSQKAKSVKAPPPSRATAQAVTDGSAWSAAGGKSPSLMATASDSAPSASGAGTALGVGAALLALGLVGLVGGLAVAETRKRRSFARRASR